MKYDQKGIIATIIFHGLLLSLLILLGFSTPLPLPAEQGFVIDFGTSEKGRGKVEPSRNKPMPVVKPQTATKPVKDNFMTQDAEDAPSLPPVKPKETITKPKITPKVVKQTEPIKEEVKEERKPNPNFMYSGSSKNQSSGEGTDNVDGNKGSEEGVDAGSHFIGSAGGDGISFSLQGRNRVRLPNPQFNCQKEGVVVVLITVDRSGKVTDVREGVKGTTTPDKCLLDAARMAALSSTFTPKSDAPMYQKGTITYQFKLK